MTRDRNLHIAIIGGSGLGQRLLPAFASNSDTTARDNHRATRKPRTISHRPRTPFGFPSAPIITTAINGETKLSLLSRHGDGHVLNPRQVPSRANIFALKTLGVTHIVATGACGSLTETIRPGDVVLADQLIDRTDGRSRTFFEHAAVHVEFADPFCPVIRAWLLAAARRASLSVHDRGTYLCMEGPSFSTRAESHLHRQFGAHVIGMTALPETRLAREAEIAYALVALPTDYDCWDSAAISPRPPKEAVGGESSDQGSLAAAASRQSLLAEIIGNLNRAADASIRLILAALADTSILAASPSPAHSALELAVWSDKSRIPRAEINRLKPLWGRVFPATPRSNRPSPRSRKRR